MSTAPDIGFPSWTYGRREISLPAILAELHEEERWRRADFPKRIEEGRMTELEQQHELNLFAGIIADFDAAAHPLPFGSSEIENQDRAKSRSIPFTWAAKINALRAIIMQRRNSWPRLVAQGRMQKRTALERLNAIEAAHAWYWHHGLDFIEGATAEDRRANIRAELARRTAWAIAHGYDPEADDAIFTGNWQPKEQAA